ncbi:EamA family transporter [Vibrio kyushuensis]|uniref:EamA family transporter n=1 Tax=Vibrio kyushuensis TaxID=2910249 RepID=UPI003D130317
MAIELGHARILFDDETNPWALAFLILASIFSWMGFAYSTFRARASTELGIVSVISKTKVVWSVLFGIVFFNESLTSLQVLGGLLILLASMLIGKPSQVSLRLLNHLHAWLAPIFLTIAIGVDKTLTEYLPSSVILFIGFSGTALLTPILFKIRYDLIKEVALNAMITAACGSISYYLLLKVLNMSAFSVVMALFQCAFMLDMIFGYFVLNEHTHLKRKMASCLLATLGILTLVS